MTPDRMRGWLRKPAAGAKRLQVVVHVGTRLQPVVDWSREQVDSMGDDPGDDIASAIFAATQEHADSEGTPQKFRLQWLGTRDRVLSKQTHHCTPSTKEEIEQDSGPLTDSAMSRELLAHLSNREGHINAITQGYDKTIAMLTGQLEVAYTALNARSVEPEPVAVAELSPEQREESIQRGDALKLFNGIAREKVPDGIDLLFEWLSRKMIPIDAQGEAVPTPIDKNKGKKSKKAGGS